MTVLTNHLKSVDYFLRAEPEGLGIWASRKESRLIWFCFLAVAAGAGVYGAVMGCWRAPLQALYVAVKLPLLILLTGLGNGLLNGMLAPLLGLNISFRQSLTAVLVSFAFTAMVLLALSPVALFVVWNTPALSATTALWSPEYGFLQLTHVGFIAGAGIVGNVRLWPLLQQLAGNAAVARNVLLAWLAGNLFLGSQICWVLRPFIWDPAGPVEFVGRQYFHGSFYETVFHALMRLLS